MAIKPAVVGALIAFGLWGLSTQAYASTVFPIPLNEEVDITGPFTPGGIFIPVSVALTGGNFQIPPCDPVTGPFCGYSVTVIQTDLFVSCLFLQVGFNCATQFAFVTIFPFALVEGWCRGIRPLDVSASSVTYEHLRMLHLSSSPELCRTVLV